MMVMEPGLDTGPVIAVVEEEIRADDTVATLTLRLAVRGAALARSVLPRVVRGEAPAVPQASGATLTRPLTKTDGWLDWHLTAEQLERRVRAMWPWPRAWTTLGDDTLQVHRATLLPHCEGGVPGAIGIADGIPAVVCGQGCLRLDLVQFPGGRAVAGAEAVRGRRLREGTRLGEASSPAPPPLIIKVD